MFADGWPEALSTLTDTEPLDDENAPTGGDNVVVAVTGRGLVVVRSVAFMSPHMTISVTSIIEPVDEPVLSHALTVDPGRTHWMSWCTRYVCPFTTYDVSDPPSTIETNF